MNFYFIIIGCTPKKRLTEQHDVFFGIATELKNLIPSINNFWPECEGKFHIDSWRKINFVESHQVEIVPKQTLNQTEKLFFVNLGGYLPNDMEEYHYKSLIVAKNKTEAIKKVKQTDFYKKFTFKGGESHIDEQYGVDIDEIYRIDEILQPEFKNNFSIKLTKTTSKTEDKLNVGYLSLKKLLKAKF